MKKDKNVMNYVLDILVKNTFMDANPRDCIMITFNCLADICKQIYEYLSDYLPVIIEYSIKVIKNADTEVKIAAIDMWEQIANEEKRRMGKSNSTQSNQRSYCYLINQKQNL